MRKQLPGLLGVLFPAQTCFSLGLGHDSRAVNAASPAGGVNGTAHRPSVRKMERFVLLVLSCFGVSQVSADSLSPPVNVTIKAVKANSAVVTWDIPEGDPVIGFAITQQKKDVRMLRFIQEVNTTTRSCALWDLEEETDYIVHVQSISMFGTSPQSEPLRFRTPKEAETQGSKNKDEVTMEEVGQTNQLRAGELIIIVVVLIMWAESDALLPRRDCSLLSSVRHHQRQRTQQQQGQSQKLFGVQHS
ncbi:fibronectin type III domain-containing protein 5 isoform X2 [Dunckerocampus dactyliophorus]|uniref:fibronectin type III domain-containing protein 5 isoform X2 n=1 Tax=Dunckerocampus dactyliophorus TaxID=161453 RepID=UPI0024069083|nr:fibronectin type III domain-containing protein 5 isoform X2 [Dunckerocampus dactyliophorus]